ncbi:hypothetical protein B0H14DRAFT_2679893 [Mycena olivaceomarginata]|nr:hypothetical protein B0H14DRAFT_2679893 [Mycena olivaceomarginata]
MSSWPVVVVTGANAGVGFGICRRLLFQLSLSNPPDAWPQRWATPAADSHGSEETVPVDGLTLIMACRSTQRAEAARKELYLELDAHIAQAAHETGVEYLDLAVLGSVFNFAAHLSKQYPYISHLIFNAACNFLDGITRPQFYVQSVGELTVDGLGWIWQSNMFGHYVLFRALEPLLKNSAYRADSRVIWSSSLEASARFYDSADWQLTKTDHSYESSIRHFVSHPGVASTKISTNLVAFGGFLDTVKVWVFYVGRVLFGSRHHPISPANASLAAVHLALVSLTYITFSAVLPSRTGANGSAKIPTNGAAASAPSDPVRFGAETTRWGRAEVGITPVYMWKEHEAEGGELLDRCDKLYQELSEKRRV